MKFHKWQIGRDEGSGGDGGRCRQWTNPCLVTAEREREREREERERENEREREREERE